MPSFFRHAVTPPPAAPPAAARLLRHSLVVAGMVLLFMAWTLYRDMLQMRAATESVLHTQEVLQSIGASREHLARMEAAQRGYLLSRSPEFLAERDAAIGALEAELGELQTLTADNAAQQLRARQLAQAAAERIQVALRIAQASTLSATDVLAAQRATRNAYALAGAMEQEELRLLALRQAEHERRQQQEVVLLAAVVLCCLLLLVPAYLEARRQRTLRTRLEQQMADLVENLPVTAWQIRSGPHGPDRFIYVAGSARDTRGLEPRAVRRDIGVVLGSIVDEDRERVRAAMEEARRKVAPFDQTYRIRKADGSIRWLRSSASLRREADGSVLWSGYWRDITREVELQQQLHEANRELEAFSYTVSHDLRAPLAAIDGFSRALQERAGAALDERSAHYLRRVRAAIGQMTELIEGLLGMAQLGRQELRLQAVDLSQLAQAVMRELREQEPGRDVEFEAQPGLVACGDARLLRQVLANLLGNAWKFTRDQQQARIEFGCGITDVGEPYFFVRDNGVGFDMDHAHRLFGAFQRLHNTTEFPGVGIGLATVARIVARHGGRVWAQAWPGEGARFCFTLAADRSGD